MLSLTFFFFFFFFSNLFQAADGSKTLLATPWARKIDAPEDKTGWKSYILEVLRNLKHADKSNWHHRMAMRAARIVYDDQKDAPAAVSAKHELSQQIFTKTMSIQVWRPEYERPGRHFVYTTRYVYFFVNLLDQLDDRAGLDQLLRRVRKKQGDFINHAKLWEDICLTYARVIRRAGDIGEGHEEGIFKPIGWDEFVANTARLENLSELAPQSAFLLELLRDSIELKKFNNNLMKVSLLEDLIADLYSRLYEINMTHVMEQATEENKEKMKVDHLLMATTDGAADAPTPASGPTTSSEAPTAPRGRTKGIARRDIQKRAETIVNSKLSTRAPNPKPVSVARAETEPSQHQDTAPTSAAPATTKEGKPAEASHNAEDDSELSEIDDDKLSKLNTDSRRAFPNLKPSSPEAEPGSEMSIPASFDGDAGGEGDGGEATAAGEAEEGEGDTMVEESFDAGVAPGDETEVVEEEEGEEGDEEGPEGADNEVEGEGEGEVDAENGGDEEGGREGEGGGETEPPKESEGEPQKQQPESTGSHQDEPEPMET